MTELSLIVKRSNDSNFGCVNFNKSVNDKISTNTSREIGLCNVCDQQNNCNQFCAIQFVNSYLNCDIGNTILQYQMAPVSSVPGVGVSVNSSKWRSCFC